MPAKAVPADTRLRRPSPISLGRVARFLPSRRSLLVGVGVIAIAAGGYAIARETSLFAIQRVDVRGGSPAVDAQVVRALAPFVGRSLVGLDGPAVLRQVDALPTVLSATYDRAFPNTLRVTVVREHPVAVLRVGAGAWVVSERGRVIRAIDPKRSPPLPRIWEGVKTIRVGEVLPLRLGGVLARVLTTAEPLRSRVVSAALTNGQVGFHLRSGLTLVLGSAADIALKVAVAEQVLQQLPSGTRTLDVSVPSRPVTSSY